MSEKTKSLIRHFFTIVGTLLSLIGLGSLVPAFEFINLHFDAVWGAISLIVGFVTNLIAFFSPKVTEQGLKTRFKIQEEEIYSLKMKARKAA